MERFVFTTPDQDAAPSEETVPGAGPEHGSPTREVARDLPFPEVALETRREVDPEVSPEMEAALREDWDRIGENPEGLSPEELVREQMTVLYARMIAKLHRSIGE